MTKLEELSVGCQVKGLINEEIVQIVAIKWIGGHSVEAVYKDRQGETDTILIFREQEEDLELVKDKLSWSFDADGEEVKLASEAYRIHLAHLFDPYLALHTSSIDPLPHQISAVYQEMLPRLPLRYILADDPGAGKTIMTGLLIKELIARGDLERCLIVSPGSLTEQWQEELYTKFHLNFQILSKDQLEWANKENKLSDKGFYIVRLDKLARVEQFLENVKKIQWDLIVVDEAHKMSASIWGNEVKYTRRFQLGRKLSEITRHFLLLTATPHNGKPREFQLFLSLIDPERFEGAQRSNAKTADVSDIMRRLVKEELLKFDGTPLFPERRAYTVNYDLSEEEKTLYEAVTEYVRNEYNRADKLDDKRKNTIGFALTILQRRLASSPEAIYQSLRRRRMRLEDRVLEEYQGRREDTHYVLTDDFDEDDLTSYEREEAEKNVVDQASASKTVEELKAEIESLKELEYLADAVRHSGQDRKWDELSSLLQENEHMFSSSGQREKIIIFTESKDTLLYLTKKIQALFGKESIVVTIHGGMSREERKRVEELFRNDKDARILIATDAAGEGINLQRAHLMINYDLPWNPNRLEQRFGRIHRIGQMEVCHLWNLVSRQTREGVVFQRLFDKLEEERKALGGKVFDILGKVSFDNRSLRELLIEAIRYGNDPVVRKQLQEVVDDSLDVDVFRKLIAENALTDDAMDVSVLMKIRADLERMEARKLQPHFIEAFFVQAFSVLGGRIHEKEPGRYEITHVPKGIRNQQTDLDGPILRRYERICFEQEDRIIAGRKAAELVCPGHPLLEAVVRVIREKYDEVLNRGAVFIDENDYSTEPRLLFYVESSIQDGVILSNGNKRVISKNIHFVELKEDGTAINAGYAPYLDYRAASQHEFSLVQDYLQGQTWLTKEAEDRACEYAVSKIIPAHFSEVKRERIQRLNKVAKAVKERMSHEIQYWDFKAIELREKEEAGKGNQRLTSFNAERRAEELEERLEKRLGEINQEKKISPRSPVITGGSLIIPKGLLQTLTEQLVPDKINTNARQEIERIGMRTVMDIEKKLGFLPKDVSKNNYGYDIESQIPEKLREKDGSYLRFIEVKGRAKGANTVTITKNEMLYALNSPDRFILALVEVDGEKARAIYLKEPFKGQSKPNFMEVSRNFNIKDLIKNSKIIYRD